MGRAPRARPALTFAFDPGDDLRRPTQSRRMVHRYDRPGSYTARARLLADGEEVAVSDAIGITVTARPLPQPTIRLAVDPASAAVGDPVVLTATVAPAPGRLGGRVAYRFDVGDGAVRQSTSPQIRPVRPSSPPGRPTSTCR